MQIITTSITKPPKFLFYGDAGLGKTDLLTSFPNPIIVRAEDRHDHFIGAKVSKMHTNIVELVSDLDWLISEKHDFKTVGIDTFDTVESLVWKHLCDKYGARSISDPYCKAFTFGKGYEIARDYFVEEIFSRLDILSSKRKMIVVGLAHMYEPWVVDNEGNSYPKYQPLIHKKLEQKLEGFFDVIGFLELKTIAKQTDNVTIMKSTGERILRFENSARYLSKTWKDLKGEIIIPEGKGWEVIRELMPKGKVKQPDKKEDDKNDNENKGELAA